MRMPKLDGLIAATVTPMNADRSVDEAALRSYLRWLADLGVTGVAVNVDTGEGPHLYPHERLRILEIVVDEVGDDVTVVAGLAAAFTQQAREVAKDTAATGVDAFLVFPISVYQGQPLDPEIPARYHAAIADASGLPLIAFQLQPALGGVNFSTEVLRRLMTVEGVVAIKEASFDAKRFVETTRTVHSLPGDRIVLNGNDNFLLEAYVLGADGALLGFGTLGAAEQVEMLARVRKGDIEGARELGERLQDLCDVIFGPPVTSYRARTKYALHRLGVIGEPHVREPLLPLSDAEKAAVDAALERSGVTA